MAKDSSGSLSEASRADRTARRWDLVVTVSMALLLLIPIPFVQFRSWPERRLILERPVLPWSSFRLCYRPLDTDQPVVEQYRFDRSGRLNPPLGPAVFPMVLESREPPLLQWQKHPEMGLQDLHAQASFLDITVRWQPVLVYPLRMLKDVWKDHPLGFQGGGARR